MAHPAAAASRTRLGSRASSPNDDNLFTTANTFTGNILHSTPQQGNTASLDLYYSRFPDSAGHGSDASAGMSIEIGRGIKRGANENDDASSIAFSHIGNDFSQHELTNTPPVRSRHSQRKSDGTLRKEASVRGATDTVQVTDTWKRGANGPKQRSISHNVVQPGVESETREHIQSNGAYHFRGSRFTRQVSSTYTGLPRRFTANGQLEIGQETPRRAAVGNNATIQSVTYTANHSFMLPDLPNIAELVSGVRRDGSPTVKRSAARSRLVSGSIKSQPLPDVPVASIPVPEDERVLYAGLQLLQDQVAQLEAEKSEAYKNVEEYKSEVTHLRGQLHFMSRTTDNAIGSEEESLNGGSSRRDHARLKSQVKSLQERLDKSERKIGVSEITIGRVSKERDALLTQIGHAFFANEELASENEAFRQSHAKLQEENEALEEEFRSLQDENTELRDQLSRIVASRRHEMATGQAKGATSKASSRNERQEDEPHNVPNSRQRLDDDLRSKKGNKSRGTSSKRRSIDVPEQEQEFKQDLAWRIEKEVQKHRDEAAAKAHQERLARDRTDRSANFLTRSKSRTRREVSQDDRAPLKRQNSAPANMQSPDAELSIEFEVPGESKGNAALPEEDTRDITMLSDIDTSAVADLRRKIEAERQARRHQKSASAGDADVEADKAAEPTRRQNLPRKSSLKDLTGRFNFAGETVDDIVRDTRTVRVQSPHSSQDVIEPGPQDTKADDISVVGNSSCRRRRASSVEGMTSAFILPDITIDGTRSLPAKLDEACIQHKAAECTVCTRNNPEVEIPLPIPVTDREEYGNEADATIRPAQEPALALAIVIKNLQDEIAHLKIQRECQNRLYNQHDPAMSRRRRHLVKTKLDSLTGEIEKRSDQVYKLYDVLEGQKQAAQFSLVAKGKGGSRETATNISEKEDTMQSLVVDPAELSGRIGRKAPSAIHSTHLDGMDDLSDAFSEDNLPWDGPSDAGSDEA